MRIDERQAQRKKEHPASTLAGLNQESVKGRPKEERETKKRISLAILPSLYDDVGKIAYIDRVSISEIVATCLDEYVRKNHEKIKEYNKLKGK